MKIIDMHCDTISEIFAAKERGEKISLRESSLMVDLTKMKKGGYSVQNFALFVEQTEGESSFSKVKQLITVFQEEMEQNRDLIRQVYTTSDILKNEADGKLSALLTVEEGGVCEGKFENLHFLYEKGVRMMTLTWNFPNEIGYPNYSKHKDCYTPNIQDGLTETGIQFVQEMERLGMLIDVSHLSDAGFYDVLKHTKRPFVASHSNARSICPWVRNLTDDMIRKLGERGGVIGLNFCGDFLRNRREKERKSVGRRPKPGGDASLMDIVEHAKYIANVGGIECVGLGSDFDGIPPHPELSGADQLPKLAETFAKCGFHENEIDKILYQNVFRVYNEILGT